MVTIEDYDVSECFHHSRSTESVKSAVSETYLSKPSIAKRRANQQETEQFYFVVRGGYGGAKGNDFRDIGLFLRDDRNQPLSKILSEASISFLYLEVGVL